MLQEYEVKDNKSTVAVTAGNKAFIFWRVSIFLQTFDLQHLLLQWQPLRRQGLTNVEGYSAADPLDAV